MKKKVFIPQKFQWHHTGIPQGIFYLGKLYRFTITYRKGLSTVSPIYKFKSNVKYGMSYSKLDNVTAAQKKKTESDNRRFIQGVNPVEKFDYLGNKKSFNVTKYSNTLSNNTCLRHYKVTMQYVQLKRSKFAKL